MRPVRFRKDVLPLAEKVDVESAQRVFRMRPNRLVCEMLPSLGETPGGILLTNLSQARRQPCVGVILATGRLRGPRKHSPDSSLKPGDIVFTHPDDGKRVWGFKASPYRAQSFETHQGEKKAEVRFFGCMYAYNACTAAQGSPTEVPWWESVIGVFDMDSNSMRPVGDNVLVRLPNKLEKSRGGIFLPDVAQKRDVDTAEVVATGEYVEDIKVGDTIVYERRGLLPIVTDDPESEFAFVAVDGIYCVVQSVDKGARELVAT